MRGLLFELAKLNSFFSFNSSPCAARIFSSYAMDSVLDALGLEEDDDDATEPFIISPVPVKPTVPVNKSDKVEKTVSKAKPPAKPAATTVNQSKGQKATGGR